MAGIVPVKLYKIARKNKDDLVKTFTWIVLIAVIIGLITSGLGFYQSSLKQASQTGPSANSQWQYTMKWVRENTAEDATFLHWWDYGYWVETLGDRGTLSDGGHFEGARKDHMIGRYVLTTPEPATALSFMKSNNATHLLIDSSDIGKYGAYSRIGSAEDMKDRRSYIKTFNVDEKQTRETRNETIRIYQGGGFALDEDLIYSQEGGKDLFLPRGKAALGAIVLSVNKIEGNETTNISERINQPKGVFFYNGQQHRIPIRKLYYQGEIIEFDSGINSTVRMVPSVGRSGQGVNINPLGSAMYLSRKVSPSLVAQLYIMNDPHNRYPELEIAHKQHNRIVQMLKMQNAIPKSEDFVKYGGIRGPIKIWEVGDIPEDIKAHKELAQRNPYGDDWTYGMLDELKFREE